MYEFLAPWGVLVPVVSAVVAYVVVAERRRAQQLRIFDAPRARQARPPSRTVTAPLSILHG